jgi:hypothetical protein
MKYIEIKDGLSVKIDDIESIERNEDFTCYVRTHHNTYDSTFPYMVLLELLERRDYGLQEKEEKIMNIQKEIGTFAG